jgi:hypothetical protein
MGSKKIEGKQIEIGYQEQGIFILLSNCLLLLPIN